jgi:two-component system, OmpR family, phosphate regulon sensor histidine kinase PhoR
VNARIATFFIAAGAGFICGNWLFNAWGAALGVLVSLCCWMLWDSWQANKLLRGLQQNSSVHLSEYGFWGELHARYLRLIKAQDKLTQEQQGRLENFLAAIQASPNGVVLLDEQGRIEWSNLTAGEHFGFEASRDLLQFIGNLVRDPDFINYFNVGDYSQEVVVTGRPPGAVRSKKISVQLHPYAEGKRLLLSRDVTALEQAEAMRRDFVANVSHEIRTPLTVLSGFVETLQTLHLDATQRNRYLILMAQQAGRMQTLVGDLLTLSKLEASPLPGVEEKVQWLSLLRLAFQDGLALSEHLGQAVHQFAEHLDADTEVLGSQTELQSAVANLLSNAVRYTPPGGQIKLRWQRLPDGSGQLSVQDTGPGIATEHLHRLTERFYRVDRSRSRESGGTGLGLAIVKHVVQRHGGQLHIESAQGEGSTFSFTLPAIRLNWLDVRPETQIKKESSEVTRV